MLMVILIVKVMIMDDRYVGFMLNLKNLGNLENRLFIGKVIENL